MSERLRAGEAVDAADTDAPWEPLPPEKVIAGAASTRYLALDITAEREVGLWEHSVGISRDVEADEVFVVLAGDATLEFIDPPLAPIELRPGVIVRLEDGMSTVWTIRATLRKLLVAP